MRSKGHVYTGLRVLLGIDFFLNGLNHWLHFLPLPTPNAAGAAFIGALFATGFWMTIVKLVESTVGIALLANRFVPLSLAVIFPISVNIFLYDTFLDLQGFVAGIVTIGLNVALIFYNLKYYRPMLVAKTGEK